MTDFFQSGGDEIDFDRAASAFPDISLDGEGDIPIPSQAPPLAAKSNSGFSFDDFDSPPTFQDTAVKVTGDDEIEKFESDFPDIDVGQVSRALSLACFESGSQVNILKCVKSPFHNTCRGKALMRTALTRSTLQKLTYVLIHYTAAPILASATTILRCNLCPTTSTICVFVDSDLEPTH
jgi:hypothetical protein